MAENTEQSAAGAGVDEAAVAGAMGAMDRFMVALNARDEAGVNAAFNFPHVRIASGKVAIWETEGEYDLETFLGRAGDGWASSAFDERTVLHAGPDKVHFMVQFSRFTATGDHMGAFKSLWVVTCQDGRWGIQARSSFAS